MPRELYTFKDHIRQENPEQLRESAKSHPKSGKSVTSETLICELLAGILPGVFSANVRSATQYGQNSNNPQAGMTTYPSQNNGLPFNFEEEGEEDEEDEMGDMSEEELEQLKTAKVDRARKIFQDHYNRPDVSRADIINSFMKDLGVTNSTAFSYYTRFLKEFGVSSKEDNVPLGQGAAMGGMGDQNQAAAPQPDTAVQPEMPEVPQEEPADPNRAGIIRTVPHAHLVFKRQAPDGTYEELWIYNIHDSTADELQIRRDILAGTDIPPQKTQSPDGKEKYVITTMGNAQMLKIMGLPN